MTGMGRIQIAKINHPNIVLHLGYSYSGNPAPAGSFNVEEFNKLVMVRIFTKKMAIKNEIKLKNIYALTSVNNGAVIHHVTKR